MFVKPPAPAAAAPPGPAAPAAPPQPQYRKYSALFKDLPHGKVQCYNELIGGKENCDGSGTLPYLPVYQGPPEGLAETPELAKEFPLILSDVHAHRLSQHSYLHNVAYLRELQPYPWLQDQSGDRREVRHRRRRLGAGGVASRLEQVQGRVLPRHLARRWS